MEKIIKELNSEVLDSMGFYFDGAYWVSPCIPFRLQSDGNGAYQVTIENAPVGAGTPPPIQSNHQLLLLMVHFSQMYLQSQIQKLDQVASPDELINLINRLIDEYMNLPSTSPIKLIAVPAPHGIQIEPDNEETLTLMSGIMCEFTVIYDDGEMTVYVDPNAMSYDYIKRLDPNREPVKVLVSNEDCKVPFFGVGVRRIKIV